MIVVVSGLPRSGTSMMMQMLKAGGMPVLSDDVRSPDADNPRGYLELEKVKKLREDSAWVGRADGMAIKVVSVHLADLPKEYVYKVIFMTRPLDEILASQAVMMERRGEKMPTPEEDAALKEHFLAHLRKVSEWMRMQPHMTRFGCAYNRVIADPAAEAERISEFLELPLNIAAMASVVDGSLYRQRRT